VQFLATYGERSIVLAQRGWQGAVMTREEEIEAAWRLHAEPPRRGGRNRELRDRLAEAQNWRCCHCGGRMDGTGIEPTAPTFEHVVPISRGGGHTVDNLAICCALCNGAGGARPTPREVDGLPGM